MSEALPLIVTAELPRDLFAWANGLRRAHFPPERNRIDAHATLFHALPPPSEPEVRRLLAELAGQAPPAAEITGLMKLGRGTAIRIESAAMAAVHAEISERMHGMLTAQDQQRVRLHVTIQNKVTPQEATALYNQLAPTVTPRPFRFRALGLYAYDGGDWRPLREFAFRGRIPG